MRVAQCAPPGANLRRGVRGALGADVCCLHQIRGQQLAFRAENGVEVLVCERVEQAVVALARALHALARRCHDIGSAGHVAQPEPERCLPCFWARALWQWKASGGGVGWGSSRQDARGLRRAACNARLKAKQQPWILSVPRQRRSQRARRRQRPHKCPVPLPLKGNGERWARRVPLLPSL